MSRGWIKVCGVTSVADAEAVVRAGADAIGLNLWPRSPRSVSWALARTIREAVRGEIEVVTVTVNDDLAALQQIAARVDPDWLQLHGDEPDAWAQAFQPRAYRAVGLAVAADVDRARVATGPWVLVDARDDVLRGGTGVAPPASLAAAVCAARPTILAGGLGPDNVAAAIAAFAPRGVDAASGVEAAPGRKDLLKVQTYVQAARAAFARLAGEE
jgi:phosphoribosylanthranilate isomerase